MTSAVKGGTVEIPCKPLGAPKPTVVWFKGSTELGSTKGRFEVLDDGTLRIKNVQKKDEGSYSCVGKNSLGSAKKDTYLSVKGNTSRFQILKQSSV